MKNPLIKLFACTIAFSCYARTQISKENILQNSFSVEIDATSICGNLTHFWESTGFCPPEPHDLAYKFDLSDDMAQNLAYIASVPHRGIQQVRIHWLMNLIIVESFQGGVPVYDWRRLDQMVKLLFVNRLKPGFELMGNPGGLFSDFDNKTVVYMWRDLVRELALHYIDIYGAEWIRKWNFETWNEPDCRDFDMVNMSVQGFLNYYDACSEGLKAADSKLIMGGPGDGCNDHRVKYAVALLSHIVNGTNYFTGERGVRIDFLSFHRKGNGTAKLILDSELKTMEEISRKYPSLAGKPFFNDEADPLVGWSKPKWWRADVTYAAMVAKIIAQHQNIILANGNSSMYYALLSNDNAFLSWYPNQFTERTLLARFQMNNTEVSYTYFVRKPVHSVMGLLAYLGEMQVSASLRDRFGHQISNQSEVGVLASIHSPVKSETSDSWQLSVLIYSSNDTETEKGEKHQTNITLYAQLDSSYAQNTGILAIYTLNNEVSNPYRVWMEMGHPDFPSDDLFHQMMKQEDPLLSELKEVNRKVVIPITLYQPQVTFLHICAKPRLPPETVVNITFVNVTVGKVLIAWSDQIIQSRCILTYDVLFARNPTGPYTKISWKRSFFTSFLHAPTDGKDDLVRGYYRVRAVDYWENPGHLSVPIHYPT
ncbi:hypothetical protein ScPMuIL_001542 [Solemya velum]